MRLIMLRQTAVEREPYRPIISIAPVTCNMCLLEALGDKIILSKLLENLGVPQMPVLGPQNPAALCMWVQFSRMYGSTRLLSTYTKVNKAEVSWQRLDTSECVCTFDFCVYAVRSENLLKRGHRAVIRMPTTSSSSRCGSAFAAKYRASNLIGVV